MKPPAIPHARARRMTPKQRAKMHESMGVALDAMQLIAYGLHIYSRLAEMEPGQRAAVMERAKTLGQVVEGEAGAPPPKRKRGRPAA